MGTSSSAVALPVEIGGDDGFGVGFGDGGFPAETPWVHEGTRNVDMVVDQIGDNVKDKLHDKIPAELLKRIQGFSRKLGDTMRSEHKCTDRILKLETERRLLADHRVPNGCKPHALPFVSKQFDTVIPDAKRMIQSEIRNAGSIRYEIPAGLTYEEAREGVHIHYLNMLRQIDLEVTLGQQRKLLSDGKRSAFNSVVCAAANEYSTPASIVQSKFDDVGSSTHVSDTLRVVQNKLPSIFSDVVNLVSKQIRDEKIAKDKAAKDNADLLNMLLARSPAEHLQRHEELLTDGKKWVDSNLVLKTKAGRPINDTKVDHLALYIIAKHSDSPLLASSIVPLLAKSNNGKSQQRPRRCQKTAKPQR